jgi:hypothetical protein
MRKAHVVKRLLTLLLILSLLPLLTAAGYQPVSAQEEETPVQPGLIDHLEELERVVQRMRGLDGLRPVTRLFPTRDEAIEALTDLLEVELTPDLVFETTQFYRAFDFVEADFNLVTTYTELLHDQVGGFYNTETGEMNVLLLTTTALVQTLPPLEQIIYAHEYTHALQDHHFGLGDFMDITDEADEADEAMARLSLVEGDAMMITQEYTTYLISENPGAIFQILLFSLFGDASLPPGTPPILEAELTAPYLIGLEFVSALYRDGGWEAVNAAYANPPRSMAEVMDPRRYLDGFQPVAVDVEPVGDALGGDWSLLFERRLGMFYLRQYLRNQLPPGEVNPVIRPWAGDHLRLYHNAATDERAWVLRLAWDAPEAITAFDETFAAYALARFDADAESIARDGGTCWRGSAPPDVLCLVAADGDSLLVYAPALDTAEAMLAQQN